MSRSELAQDGTVIWTTLVEPAYGFGRALTRRRTSSVVALSTLLSLAATLLVLPAIDTDAVAAEKVQPDMTAHERALAVESATKLFRVIAWTKAALAPLASALLLAVALWLGFRVAGARAPFRGSFTVAAYALVPAGLKALLAAPAALARAPVAPDQLPQLLPSSLAVLLPPSWPAPALAAATAFDLFSLWTVSLAGVGMMKASGASRLRTACVMFILFAAYVALFKVVPSTRSL